MTPDLRALTTEERAALQTFPATFRWTGSKTEKEQMIGNAVPVKLAQYVADHISEFIEAEQEDEDD